VADLRQAIEGLYVNLRERMPGIRLELVTGMAEGADRIAAEAALAVGLDVHAVLPMPLEMYLDDFDAASQQELRDLLADPRVTCTELRVPDDVDAVAASVQGPARDLLYVALAERFKWTTNLLLAVWDGKDQGLPGGTGDTVLRYLGLVTDARAREPRELGLGRATGPVPCGECPVFWLPARRSGAGEAPRAVAGFLGVADDGEVVVTGPQIPASVAAELDKLVDYSRDAQAHVDLAVNGFRLATEQALGLRPEARMALQAIDLEYRRADLLAVHHQRRSDRLFKAFSLMAALMGLLFLVYAKIYPGKLFLASYLALFAAGYLLFAQAGRQGWFTRHLMYRALAESLRTRFYLSMAGIPAPGVEQRLMRLLGVRRIAGFGWIGHVLLATTPFEVAGARHSAQCLKWIRGKWLEDQGEYFRRKAHALHRSHHRLQRCKQWILGAIVLAIVSLIVFKQPLTRVQWLGLPLKSYIVFLLGLVPFWLGVWELYQAKMATKELSWQYQNQLFHLDRAASLLRNVHGGPEAAQVFNETAERLLADTYLWTVQRFHREHDPPAAG
jgi:hypothetical protein